MSIQLPYKGLWYVPLCTLNGVFLGSQTVTSRLPEAADPAEVRQVNSTIIVITFVPYKDNSTISGPNVCICDSLLIFSQRARGSPGPFLWIDPSSVVNSVCGVCSHSSVWPSRWMVQEWRKLQDRSTGTLFIWPASTWQYIWLSLTRHYCI